MLAPYRALFASGCLLFSAPLFGAEAEWPQFRGPAGQGHAPQALGLPTAWSEHENIVWKAPLPGKGWSSPVILGNQIWLTTAIETPLTDEERAKRLADNPFAKTLVLSGPLSLRALCVDRRSGQIVHNVELLVEQNPQPMHAMNSYASPTPVLEAGRLYCHFGAFGTACLDTDRGEVVWTNRELVINHENGPGSSPVLWQDLLIFHCDGSDIQFIVALDKATGRVAWKTPRSGKMNDNPQLKKSYGTPLILEVAGEPQLFSPASDWLYGYDPATGRELWKMPYETLGFSVVPRPVAGHGMLFLSTSFMQPQILGVKYDGEKTPKIAWRFAKQAPTMPSPLLVGEELYIVSERGVATCLNALTGEVHWTERLPGNYAASPLLADGKIHYCSRDGETTVIEPGKTFRRLAVNKLDGQILASPAAIKDAIYLRTDKALYRIEYLK
ncbi:MAG: PQQ-binding-like beta-propeller repeat protein [Pirellulaceae bacterium]|nr:PQQ-binding-like beta-propeller repeat protein [Pirellulaceae bacterium]